MGSWAKETFSEIVTENLMQDAFSMFTGDALDYIKIDAANMIEDQYWANVLSNTAEFVSDYIGEKLADSKNNAFVNAHFFAPIEVHANARVNTRSELSTDASTPSTTRIWSVLSTTLKSLAQEGSIRVRRMAGTDSVNSIHRVIQALTVSSLTSEVNSNNLIARSALNQFIVLTSTFTSSFTAKLAENTLKLFDLMKQNPTRTITDFGTDQAILRELGLTGCYLYFEVRDASGAWVRASSSMTLADLVLHNSEIRVGDPKITEISETQKWQQLDPTNPQYSLTNQMNFINSLIPSSIEQALINIQNKLGEYYSGIQLTLSVEQKNQFIDCVQKLFLELVNYPLGDLCKKIELKQDVNTFSNPNYNLAMDFYNKLSSEIKITYNFDQINQLMTTYTEFFDNVNLQFEPDAMVNWLSKFIEDHFYNEFFRGYSENLPDYVRKYFIEGGVFRGFIIEEMMLQGLTKAFSELSLNSQDQIFIQHKVNAINWMKEEFNLPNSEIPINDIDLDLDYVIRLNINGKKIYIIGECKSASTSYANLARDLRSAYQKALFDIKNTIEEKAINPVIIHAVGMQITSGFSMNPNLNSPTMNFVITNYDLVNLFGQTGSYNIGHSHINLDR